MSPGMGRCPVWLPGSLMLLGLIISRFVELLQVFNLISPSKQEIVFPYYYYLSIQYSRPWMSNLIDVHLQLSYLQTSPNKPEKSSEAVVSLLQRVNFAGSMVCKNSVCFFIFARQDVFSPASFFPPPSLPLFFPPTLIHMELRKETGGKDLSREVGYVSESNLNSLWTMVSIGS